MAPIAGLQAFFPIGIDGLQLTCVLHRQPRCLWDGTTPLIVYFRSAYFSRIFVCDHAKDIEPQSLAHEKIHHLVQSQGFNFRRGVLDFSGQVDSPEGRQWYHSEFFGVISFELTFNIDQSDESVAGESEQKKSRQWEDAVLVAPLSEQPR